MPYACLGSFAGTQPPVVAMHFLDVSCVIDDEVPPDKLPVPLDDKTVLVSSATGKKTGCGCILALVAFVRGLLKKLSS